MQLLFLLIVSTLSAGFSLSLGQNTAPKTKYYNYFAFGSNMASATMTALRQLDPVASSAAVLPGHRLAFNVPGTPLIEPSWASVEPVKSQGDVPSEVVHGVLYKLTQDDFESVCRTEGVPFGYRLHRCKVIPYNGNNDCAGQEALASTSSKLVPAFTLRAGRKMWRQSTVDIPPSKAYMNVLLRGAEEYRIDREYVNYLRNIPVGQTLIGDGIAEEMLKTAEEQQRRRWER